MSKPSTRNVGISKSLQALPRPFLEFSFFTKKLTTHVTTAHRFLRQADRTWPKVPKVDVSSSFHREFLKTGY